ncbi:MAG: DNA mismatch repair protein MutS [Verrucomicrobiota bacterium]
MGSQDAKETPMMRQYLRLRRQLPEDVLLFFRLGDFYELFFEDAKQAAGLLNVALTKRNEVPMCGVPHHAAEAYLGKLIEAGRRVAIAEQTSEPQAGKIVEREVRQILSAGSLSDLALLPAKRANYLAAVYQHAGLFGLAFVDLSTAEFRVTEFTQVQALEDEVERLSPAELLKSDAPNGLPAFEQATETDGYTFLPEAARDLLQEHFGVASLDGFGCSEMEAGLGAAGAILHYLKLLLRQKVDHLRSLQPYRSEEFVGLDRASQRNLDLVPRKGSLQPTLLEAIDETFTPMGSRMLRHWILHPLRDLSALRNRQDVVQTLVEEPFVLAKLRETLREIKDIERISSRLSQGLGNPRDLGALGRSLLVLPTVAQQLKTLFPPAERAQQLCAALGDFSELSQELQRALVEQPPVSPKEGGLFRDGYHEDIDTLRDAAREGQEWFGRFQAQEIERTGIKSLKVKFNHVFGYFIEITKTHLDQVPADYLRKQTMANAERFITTELKERESVLLGADERAQALEYETFLQLRARAIAHLEALQKAARAIAEVDVLQSLAETARKWHYCRPQLNHSRDLRIVEGRHPVLEQEMEDPFVPNDTLLEAERQRLLLLTGPNMAGKSTYIRQVALLTLLAQIGSFVPAAEAEIGLVDQIFTRVGASDDLARGHSTFMVEMNETSLILNNATERSLVIVDEIGRGTSTYDGLSIAWSVAEHLHSHNQARTLFATHYHELTALPETCPASQNFNVAVREWKERIIFLRKIVPGAADRSYGIQVARLAGIPESVIERARELLAQLEGDQPSAPLRPSPAKGKAPLQPLAHPELGLFGSET